MREVLHKHWIEEKSSQSDSSFSSPDFFSDMSPSSLWSILMITSSVSCSIPAWLMLPKSKQSEDWIRNNRRGQLFGVLEMVPEYYSDNSIDSDDDYYDGDDRFDQLQDSTSLTRLYDSWFKRKQEKEELVDTTTPAEQITRKNMKNVHNGHQPTPQPRRIRKKIVMTTRPPPTPPPPSPPPQPPSRRPSLQYMVVEFLPRHIMRVGRTVRQYISTWLLEHILYRIM